MDGSVLLGAFPLIIALSHGGDLNSHPTHGYLGPPAPASSTKQHLNQLSHLCRAYQCDRPTDKWPCYSVCNNRLHLRMYTVPQKKVPTFKLSVTLSNLNRFSTFLHCWKAYEICYKMVRQYPPHLRHVATLPWEIKNSNFLQIFSRYGRKCKQIAFVHWF